MTRAFLVAVLAGCSASPAAMPDAAQPDLAQRLPFPSAASSGGPVIATPKIAVITFAGDALATTIGQFNDQLQASSYFASIGEEYGVGAIASVSHLALAESAPATIDDPGIQSWLQSRFGSAPFGAADASTLYAIYYPASTVISYGGKASCTGWGAYHRQVDAGGIAVGYAVLPRCPSPDPQLSDTDKLTIAASHEYAEWATDPFPLSTPAWDLVEADSAAWTLAFEF